MGIEDDIRAIVRSEIRAALAEHCLRTDASSMQSLVSYEVRRQVDLASMEPRTRARELPATMSPTQLAKELDVSVRTLERWRAAGTGPVFRHREGSRFYRYYGTDVVAWLENMKPAN